MKNTSSTYIGNSDIIQPQQGWECPKCGRVYAPTNLMCWYCPNNAIATTDVVFTHPNYHPIACNEFEPYDGLNNQPQICKKCGLPKNEHL